MPEPIEAPTADNPGIENAIVTSLRRIIRAVDVHSRRLESNCGLTAPQLTLLREAVEESTPSTSSLARRTHLSKATVTGILDRLEARGFLNRTRDVRDRRSVAIRVTSRGERAATHSPSLLHDTFRARLAALEDWEQYSILATLQRVASMMDAKSLDAAPLLTAGPMIGETPREFSSSSESPSSPAGR